MGKSFVEFRGQHIAELHQQGVALAGVADAVAVAAQGRILADGQIQHRRDAAGLSGDQERTALVGYGGGGHQKASGATVASKEVAMQMLADLNEMAKPEN